MGITKKREYKPLGEAEAPLTPVAIGIYYFEFQGECYELHVFGRHDGPTIKQAIEMDRVERRKGRHLLNRKEATRLKNELMYSPLFADPGFMDVIRNDEWGLAIDRNGKVACISMAFRVMCVRPVSECGPIGKCHLHDDDIAHKNAMFLIFKCGKSAGRKRPNATEIGGEPHSKLGAELHVGGEALKEEIVHASTHILENLAEHAEELLR
jgi:hypothetical protein